MRTSVSLSSGPTEDLGVLVAQQHVLENLTTSLPSLTGVAAVLSSYIGAQKPLTGPMTCHRCHETFTSTSDLKLHIESHKTEATDPVQCFYCVSTFPDHEALTEHTSTRHADRALSCPRCGEIMRFSVIEKHIEACKGKIGRGRRRSSLERGRLLAGVSRPARIPILPEDIEPWECRVCTATSQFVRGTLSSHMKSCKRSLKRGTFVLREGVQERPPRKNHKRKRNAGFATKDEEFECETCLEIFSTRQQVQQHIQRHVMIPTKFECFYCLKGFNSAKKLRDHWDETHEDRSIFNCHVCGNTYAGRGHLREHVNRCVQEQGDAE